MESSAKRSAVLVLLICVLAGLMIATKFKISTDLSLFLPEPESRIERLLHHQLDNGASSNLIFVALKGLKPEEMAELNLTMRELLEQSGRFRKVSSNARSLGHEQLNFLVENRYLLSHEVLSDRFSEEGLRSALAERIQGLSSPQARLEKKYLRNDPTGEVIGLLSEWQGKLSKHKIPEQLHGVWFSDDHSRTLLLAEIKADISKLEIQTDAVQTIRDIFDQIKKPGLEMIMTGPAAFAVESGEDIKSDVRILTYMAIAFVILFLWLAFRSFRAVFLTVAPLLVGVLIATAATVLMHGQIHGITLAFGVTLAGVAVDYPIHLLTGLGNDRRENERHVKKVWPTLRLGVLSTVIAYGAFLISGFSGLVQLGFFTIVGLCGAAAFARYVLPYVSVNQVAALNGLASLHRFLRKWASKSARLRWIIPVVGILSLGSLIVTSLPVLHLNVDSLSPIKDSRRAEGKLLRADLGFWSGGKMLVVTGASMEDVLQRSEMLDNYLEQQVELGVISGFDMASHFLPSQEKQTKNLAALQDVEAIRKNLNRALLDYTFKPKIFDPFIVDVVESADRNPITPSTLAQTTLGERLKPLLFEFEEGAAGVILLHDVMNGELMDEFARNHMEVEYLDLKKEATNLVARNVKWVSMVMIACVVLIYLVLSKSFGSVVRPFRIMVPTFSAAMVAAAILVNIGFPLSIFHLISLLLVVGLGLDYALFFNRLPDNHDEWNTTFKSLWVCGVTTVLVFGILTFSQTPPLRAIGVTVGIGALISIIFAAMWAAAPAKKSV